jgi:hypothetical protein
MKPITLPITVVALFGLLLAGCGNNNKPSPNASGDAAVNNASAIAATIPESTEPGSGDSAPASQPESTEPVAL